MGKPDLHPVKARKKPRRRIKRITFHYFFFQNKEGKEKWRNWCEQYKERVQDYNFGTLLRLDPSDDYTEKNSCFALRVQFLAIEIARNKEGKNQKIFEAAKAAKEAAAKAAAAGKMGGGCCSKC